jgi:DNA-binding winged helix-turn-helix (wHTH) protein
MSLETNGFEFGEFLLDTKEKVLWRAGKPVAITPKTFQLLLALVENHGRLVEKDELMRTVWADSYVESGNLTFTINLVRKALGDEKQNPRFIETVPRRGYRFIA